MSARSPPPVDQPRDGGNRQGVAEVDVSEQKGVTRLEDNHVCGQSLNELVVVNHREKTAELTTATTASCADSVTVSEPLHHPHVTDDSVDLAIKNDSEPLHNVHVSFAGVPKQQRKQQLSEKKEILIKLKPIATSSKEGGIPTPSDPDLDKLLMPPPPPR